MKKRIAIFYHNTTIFTIPSVVGLMQALTKEGYDIDLFTGYDSNFDKLEVGSHHLRTFPNYWQCERYGLYRLFSKALLWPLVGLRSHLRCCYQCVIGVEPQGIVDAEMFVRFTRTPLIYYSLEVMSFRAVISVSESDRALKALEKKACTRCCAAIIQDPARGAMLAETCGIPVSKHLYLPNAPLVENAEASLGYWHRLFNLCSEQKVLLHAGSLNSWTMIAEIAATAQSWPEEWILVIHGRYSSGSVWQIIGETIEKLAPEGKVFFSREVVHLDDLDTLYSSANAVLACYKPLYDTWYHGDNLCVLGLSSGKVGYALRNGVPVLTNDKTDLGVYVQDNGVGISISSVNDVASALLNIDKNPEWNVHCRELYRRDWALEERIPQITDFIASLK